MPLHGAFTDVIPHLTIAAVVEANQLDDIEWEFIQLHGAQLPVKAHAHEVLLMDNASGRWEVRQAFEFASKNH